MGKKVKKSALKKADGSSSPKASPKASPAAAPAGSPKASQPAPKAAAAAKVAVKAGAADKEKLTAQVVEEILKAIAQPESQKNSAFIPRDWHAKYKDTLGTYKKFVKACDKLQVVERENGNYVVMKAGDKSAPPAGQPSANKGGDWKQLLKNAWNIYCQATPKHEQSIEVFTSALPKGPRTTKPEGGAASPSPKASPKASPKVEPEKGGAEKRKADDATPGAAKKKQKKKAAK
eukprot:gb/GFBE01083227.1/.p1 GENE.gb/GFBE01083227.1/~~gb/GFBE01083227.1/.p1  ORF type:complete len:233 (+),score=82.26 gb/GFBE01083227.1/:1-699(+)